MGTIAEKLSYLRGAIKGIKDAIEYKGVEVGDIALNHYGDKILAISTSDANKPSVSVSAAGKITATSSGGTTSVTLSSSHDSDFKSANIKSGVTIFGVTGTLKAEPITELVDGVEITRENTTYYINITTSQNISKLCGFTVQLASMSGSYCCAASYNPNENTATYYRGGTETFVNMKSNCTVLVSNKLIRITIPDNNTIMQLYYDTQLAVAHASVAYIPR